MRNSQLDRLEAAVREANPVPNAADLRESEEAAALTLLLQDRRHDVTTTLAPTEPRLDIPPTANRRWAWAFAVALAVTVLVVGLVALLPGGDSPVVDEPTTTVPATTTTPTTSPTSPTTSPTTTATSTTVPETPAPIPPLGDGWQMVLLSRARDFPRLSIDDLVRAGPGFYVPFFDDFEAAETDWYLMNLDNGDPTLVDVDVPAGGFETGGPGVVAWATTGPETRTEAQLWVSVDGIQFQRVAEDLFAGCQGEPNCLGSEIYAAASSPQGRVVVLAYDPLIWIPDCECYDLNPVALVTDDGHQWTRQPLNLLELLPAGWQGSADIGNPVVYVDGRWLTFATSVLWGTSSETAFFTSPDGILWEPVDTGSLFEKTYVSALAASHRGVIALSGRTLFWSADGIDWTASSTRLPEDVFPGPIAAFDEGYVMASTTGVAGFHLTDIWYSPDGTTWSSMPLVLDEPALWNTIAGDGSELLALGGTQENLFGIWRWAAG